jgi:hypothetical protein
MHIFYIFVFIACLPFLNSELIASNPVKIEADSLEYSEDLSLIYASKNVSLSYKEIHIETDSLTLDTKKNWAWTSGKTVINNNNKKVESQGIMMDLETEIITINNLILAVIPPEEAQLKKPDEEKEKIYIKAETVVDSSGKKYGKNGTITLCTNSDHPHHYLFAKSFTYYPEKRIHLYNVVLHNKVLFVPLYIWVPYYTYALGKKKWVWNFPTIGKKEQKGWGYYVQNKIDYKIDPYDPKKESSILLDWYQEKDHRIGSIGAGISHHYSNFLNKNEGHLYYYQFDFKELTDTTWVKKNNQTLKWQNMFQINNVLRFKHKLETINIDERINSRGEDKRNNKEFWLTYDDLGDIYEGSFKEEISTTRSKINTQKITLNHTQNNSQRYNINYSKKDYYSTNRRDININSTHYFYLPFNTKAKQTFYYSHFEENWLNSLFPDTQLKSYTLITKKFHPKVRAQIAVNSLYDLDDKKVSADIGLNNFLYKLPEVSLFIENLKWKNTTFKQQTTIARYQEKKYIKSSQKLRTFPESSYFSVIPNTYIFEQKAATLFKDYPFKSTLRIESGINQYIFKIPEKDFFNGDAMYKLNISATHYSYFFDFIMLNTHYTSQYSPIENNSPFFSFQNELNQRNDISETIMFYFNKNRKNSRIYHLNFKWSHKFHYNWIKESEKWGNYYTKIETKINKSLTSHLEFSKKLNFKQSDAHKRFSPLRFKIGLIPSKYLSVNYFLSLNLNRLKDDKETQIENSYIVIKTTLGRKKDSQWELEAYYQYKTPNQPKYLDLSRYQIQTLSIIKNEHKRRLEIGYKKLINEITITYRFNAFANEPLKIKKINDLWKVEGRFNEKATERL